MARGPLLGKQQPRRHRQGELFPVRRWQTDAVKEKPGAAGLAVFQATAEVTAAFVKRALRLDSEALGPSLNHSSAVVQASKNQLVISFKSAKALGLTVPPSPLAIADELID